MKKGRKLKENDIFYESVISSSPGNIYWKNNQGVYIGCNTNMARILGLTSTDQIVGKTIFDLVAEKYIDIAKSTHEEDLEIMKTGKTKRLEETGLNIKGKPCTYLTEKTLVLDDNKKVIGLVGVSMDITLEKQTQKHEEEVKICTLRSLSASIAHELRTPLYSLNLACLSQKKIIENILSHKNVSANKELYNSLDLIRTITSEINNLVNNSQHVVNMHLFNIRGKEDELATKEYYIQDIIVESVQKYPFPSDMKGLVRIDRKSDFIVKTDKNMLKHVLWNLIKNSIYAIKSAKKGKIEIQAKEEQNSYCILFKDTGSGIKSSDLPHIFDEFFTTKSSGTGIGLSFCHKILKNMGASIECKSKFGEYSEFIIRFKNCH